MSTVVPCPICEFEVDLADADDHGLIPNLAESLGLTGMSTAQVDYLEKTMSEHLISHSVNDWVTAMRMADVYIAKLEEGLAKAVAVGQELSAKVKLLSERQVSMPMPQAVNPLQAGLGVPPLPPGVDMDPWAFESPRDRQEVARQRRKAGLSYVPTGTLIPHIPSGQRPEGVVGRKM